MANKVEVVSERDTDDGMVELTLEIDPELEAELRVAAEAAGVTFEAFVQDAVVRGIQRDIDAAKATQEETPDWKGAPV